MNLKDLIADVNVNEIYEHIETETLSDWVNAWQEAALTALRPVSRERVENVWRGKWDVSYDELNGFTYVTCSKCGDETVLDGCFVTTEGEPCDLKDFCPVCGAPMTDEAVKMVMERWEALKDGKGD